ncbi:MAG: alpha-galactosidase [Anaerolineales bacterium]
MPIQELDAAYWLLTTDNTAYTLGLNADGRLVHGYWGPRLPYADDYPLLPTYNHYPFNSDSAGEYAFTGPGHLVPEEYPAHGGVKYTEPSIKATFADGVRDLDMIYELHDTREGILSITLLDKAYPLRVTVHYRPHPAHDLIERWATIANASNRPILLERAWSAMWHVPPGPRYRLSHLHGRWKNEFQRAQEILQPGIKRLESRRLTTSSSHSPWFALDDGHATEAHGAVWFGALAWSGNWAISAEVTEFYRTQVGIGVNDWDFAWRLDPGASFSTPAALAGYTVEGFGGAARALHGYTRAILPHPDQPRKVLYNAWEVTGFDVNETNQKNLATEAAALGVECFVMDDGWFHGRNSDRAGLGDWFPDADKFPHGLAPLIEHVNGLGMDFGLWIEPEMVNPDSDLYREHPDWVIHFPTRARTTSRNQLILNMARADVQEHLINVLDKLLSEHNIAFIKWDMNRNASEPGWSGTDRQPRELWARYVLGVYRVWQTLRERHPDIIWQGCSGGGGRADLGILRFADQIWISDNTAAPGRLAIQAGYAQMFPACTMEAWVTDMEHEPVSLDFRFHVSMCGVLGLGGDIRAWDESQRATARAHIETYKTIRPLVQFGEQYWLAKDGHFWAVQYMSGDAGVLFAFLTHRIDPVEPLRVRLQGLDPHARYTLEGFTGARSGLAWMADAVQLPLGGAQHKTNFSSVMLRIARMA